MQNFLRRWLLPLSLSLNVFLLVLVVVHPRPPHGPPPSPAHIVERMAEDMNATDAAILRDSFARHGDRLQSAQGMEEFMGRLREALNRPEPDIAALHAAFADAKQARIDFEEVMEAVITESAPRLSADGRAKLFRPPPGPPPR